jgi:hypothetical protein
MNGRFFNERELSCDYWDGKENFRVIRDSKENLQKRIHEFGSWLDQEMGSEEGEDIDGGSKTPEIEDQ